jgi:hypothetical protein
VAVATAAEGARRGAVGAVLSLKVVDETATFCPHSHWLSRSDGSAIPRRADAALVDLWPRARFSGDVMGGVAQRKFVVAELVGEGGAPVLLSIASARAAIAAAASEAGECFCLPLHSTRILLTI